jgi:hypothetical protein
VGSLAAVLRRHNSYVVICQLLHGDDDGAAALLEDSIAACPWVFPGLRISLLVVDRTWTAASGDRGPMEVAVDAARRALRALTASSRDRLQVIVTPHEGYDGDCSAGAGSALRMVHGELDWMSHGLLVRAAADPWAWLEQVARIEQEQILNRPGAPLMVAARAPLLHDGGLGPLLVGPLSTLLGRHVQGGSGGALALCARAAAFERGAPWDANRRGQGADVWTVMDNAADPGVTIFELPPCAGSGALSPDLSPAHLQAVGATLQRLQHWETTEGRVSARLAPEAEFQLPQRRQLTQGDPDAEQQSATAAASEPARILDAIRVNHRQLARDLHQVYGAALAGRLESWLRRPPGSPGSSAAARLTEDTTWVEVLQRAVAHVLTHPDPGPATRGLALLHAAAALEIAGYPVPWQGDRSDRLARAFFEDRARLRTHLDRGQDCKVIQQSAPGPAAARNRPPGCV